MLITNVDGQRGWESGVLPQCGPELTVDSNPRWEVWTFRWYTWTISSSAPVLALHGSPEHSQAWGPGIIEAD